MPKPSSSPARFASIIAIIDYGYGNIFSVDRAVSAVGGQPLVIKHPDQLVALQADISHIILPGQGAFPSCLRALNPFLPTLLPLVVEQKKPLLGICVGMQLLYQVGYEFERLAGLGLLTGAIKNLGDMWRDRGLTLSHTLPHMAWAPITVAAGRARHPLLAGLKDGDYFYFVHSFAVDDDDPRDRLALAHYGVDFPILVARGNMAGIQCHPEKSQQSGLRLLKNFIAWQPNDDDGD